MDTSMVANAGDNTTHSAMEDQQLQDVEEIRTVRMLDLSRNNLAAEEMEMEVEEENDERMVAGGRGNGRGGRHRDYRN